MDDDESIARLMDLAGDGQVLVDDGISNPFQVSDKELPMKDRIDLNTNIYIQQGRRQKMSLMERTDAMKPHVPSCLTRATRVIQKSMIQRSEAREFANTFSTSAPQKSSLSGNSTPKNEISETPSSEQAAADDSTAIRPTASNDEGASIVGISSRPSSASTKTTDRKSSTQAIGSNSKSALSFEPNKRPRHQLMTEFIQQKREIFLFQLFINRKKSEVQRFSREELIQEKKIKEEEQKIAEEIEQYKMATVRLEAELAKQRHLAEIAAQSHSTLIRNLKHSETNCAMIRSDISKNEDLLETYRPYMGFLKKFIPEDMDIFEFFKNPFTLTDELHRIENDNLLLIQYCQHFEQVFANGVSNVDSKLFDALKQEEEMVQNIENIEVVEDYSGELAKKQKIDQQNDEAKLESLTSIIRRTYINCFGVDADIGPLTMLEKIENQLEIMFNKCERVSPEFLLMKKILKDQERREKQRKERNEKRELEQQRKIEQAIERAKRPIPRRTGRPVGERLLPIKIVKPDDEYLKLKKYEEIKEQELLYGEEK